MQANDTAFDKTGVGDVEMGAKLFNLLKINPLVLSTNPSDAEKMKRIIAFAENFQDSIGEIRRVALNKRNNELSTLDVVAEYTDIATRRHALQQELAQAEADLQPFIT
jgi:hypothetical protein